MTYFEHNEGKRETDKPLDMPLTESGIPEDTRQRVLADTIRYWLIKQKARRLLK